MENISFNRIKFLFNRYFRENWKRDAGVAAIIFAFEMITSWNEHTSAISLPLLMVFFILYSGRIFGMLGKKQQSINYLMIPASTEEKLITNICLSHFYYPAILFAASCIGIWASTFVGYFVSGNEITLKHIDFITNTENDIKFNTLTILIIILSNAIMMFGSVYFRTKAIIKTLLCQFAYFIICSIIIGYTLKLLPYTFIPNINLGEDFAYILMAVTVVLTIYFWILSYFRLRETEA